MLLPLDSTLADLAEAAGWTIKPQGACRGERCVPLGPDPSIATFTERLGMAVVEDAAHGLMAVGPESGATTLTSTTLPDLVLQDRAGEAFELRSLMGTRFVLTSWAPWCGCRMDLPVWNSLRAELVTSGIEVVTVALDTSGAAAAFLDQVSPDHPALVDARHQTVSALGFVNVPMAVWVDETGQLVRPAEPSWPGRAVFWEPEQQQALAQSAAGAHPEAWVADMFDEASRIATDPDLYVNALRSWAEHGAASPFVLRPEEVLSRSGDRTAEASRAAAHFELGTRLREDGHVDAAREHLRASHALDPDNWSYKRQSWFHEDELQRPTEHYDSDFVSDIRRVGAKNYYRPTVGVTGPSA